VNRMEKLVTVFFDMEGWWESQCRRRFDEEATVRAVSDILDKHKAKAVFNTCGIVVENFPNLVRRLHENGHEIASHGYAHENFIQSQQLGQLDDVLAKTEKLVEDATGAKPAGVRPPWLFANPAVYATIEKRGYSWISNYSVFRTEIMDNPSVATSFKPIKKVFFGLQWARSRKEPFRNGSLLEIPLLSSQDGELLGVMDPGQETPQAWIDFAYESMRKQFDRSGRVFNLNFHPWLIGTANRIEVLDRMLDYINNSGHDVKFVLAKDLLALYP